MLRLISCKFPLDTFLFLIPSLPSIPETCQFHPLILIAFTPPASRSPSPPLWSSAAASSLVSPHLCLLLPAHSSHSPREDFQTPSSSCPGPAEQPSRGFQLFIANVQKPTTSGQSRTPTHLFRLIAVTCPSSHMESSLFPKQVKLPLFSGTQNKQILLLSIVLGGPSLNTPAPQVTLSQGTLACPSAAPSLHCFSSLVGL